MIIGKISEKYSEILSEISKESSFLRLIEDLSKTNESLPQKLFEVIDTINLGDQNRTWNTVNNIANQIINEVSAIIKSTKKSYIYITASNYSELFEESDEKALKHASFSVDSFISSLDEYLQNATFDSSKSLTKAAEDLKISIEKIQLISESMKPAQGNTSLPTVSVYIPDHTELDEFSAKLAALTKIIEITCNMLNLSMVEADVAIERIESGSFFAKISANPLVVSVVTIILTYGSQHLLNQSTENSDDAVIRARSETLINVLKIREALEKNGLAMPELDSELKNSAVNLAKQLNTLIGKSQKIEINKALLEASKSMLIADNQDNKTQPQD